MAFLFLNGFIKSSLSYTSIKCVFHPFNTRTYTKTFIPLALCHLG